MSSGKITTRRFLSRLPFFAGLPEADIEALSGISSIGAYSADQSVFTQGDPADRIFIVMKGCVKLSRIRTRGGKGIGGIFTHENVFGEFDVFGGTRYFFSARALEETRLIEIRGASLIESFKDHSGIMIQMMRAMSRETQKMQMEGEQMAVMSTPQRIGCLLLHLSSGITSSGGTFSFPYEKRFAAARLGITPETFSRALALLKPMVVADHKSQIHIDSFSDLADYCCVTCPVGPNDCFCAHRKTNAVKGLSNDKGSIAPA